MSIVDTLLAILLGISFLFTFFGGWYLSMIVFAQRYFDVPKQKYKVVDQVLASVAVVGFIVGLIFVFFSMDKIGTMAILSPLGIFAIVEFAVLAVAVWRIALYKNKIIKKLASRH